MNFPRKKAATAQEDYCRRNQLPRFAPDNGICPACGRNIYRGSKETDGYTPEEAGRQLITSCPRCHHSFTD